MSAWTIANNGAGKRRWFVYRDLRFVTTPGTSGPMDIALDARGNYRRFATPISAQRVADTLNAGVAQ